jgi:hypothetical protein
MAKKPSKPAKAAPKGSKPLKVPVHSVVHFVKMLHDEGVADQFVEAAKKSKMFMTMHPDSVQFVRDYLSKNKLHHAMAAKVVDPCPGDPFECHFRD